MATGEDIAGGKQSRRSVIADIAVLLALWLFMLALTSASGEFPLNDDWNYARSVKALIDEHQLIITHWSLAASMPHILLGWLSCAFSGFSFNSLRMVSMVGGLVAAVCSYFLCKDASGRRDLSLICAALFMTNPLFYNLATTYMTDVPFMLFAGLLFLVFGKMATAAEVRWPWIAGSTLLSVLTCLTRQTGIVIALGYFFSSLRSGGSLGARLANAIPSVVSIGAIYAFQTWLVSTVGELQSYRVERAWLEQLIAKGPAFIVSNTMANLICACVYLGLFLLPLLLLMYVPWLKSLAPKRKKLALIMLAEPVVLLAVGLIMTHSVMPLGDNVLFNLGLGPILLGGEQPAQWVKAPEWFWILVTICGVMGAGAVISFLVIFVPSLFEKGRPRAPLPEFLVMVCFLYMSVISFRGFFDRYLIFPMFILMPVLASSFIETPKYRVLKPIACLLILLYGSFAVAGTHDYFAWNRARWQAVHDLVDVQKVSAMEIDAGMEFNGWYAYDPLYRDCGGIVLNPSMRHNDEYVVGMHEMKNYEVLSRYAFQRWLPWGSGEIIVQHEVH